MSEDAFDEDEIRNGTGPFPVYAGCTWAGVQGQLQAETEAAFDSTLESWKTTSAPNLPPWVVENKVREVVGNRPCEEGWIREMTRCWRSAYFRRAWAILVHEISPGSKAEEELVHSRVIDDSRCPLWRVD
jgi:hypothetical protein